jgi:hypothetical protein
MRLPRLFSAVLFLCASAVAAQVVSTTRSDGLAVANNTYGSPFTWVTLTPFDFHPLSSATAYDYTCPGGSIAGAFRAEDRGSKNPTLEDDGHVCGLYRTGGGFWFAAGLHLPNGARVLTIELAACDTNATEDIFALVDTVLKTGQVGAGSGGGCTRSLPGCVAARDNCSFTFDTFVVNNDTTTYTVHVAFGSTTTDTSLVLNSVRVGYRLQISPDPATATFADVPVGHPLHRFVEALYASGITVGCGNGNYCPDAPVTRGQLAVFLSAALGLHWAP